MPKRMLQLIAGLLAVGALAVAPVAATADSSSTAKASGGGSGCQDDYRPYSSWGNGNWYGNDDNGPYWRGWNDGDGDFGGRSWDQDCNNGSGSSANAARVGRVKVAVKKLNGSQCQHLSRSGSLGAPTDCKARWFRATGTRRWRHHIANPLPQGQYQLAHRAIDAAGNRGPVQTRRVSVR